MAFTYNEFTPLVETNVRTVLCYHFCKKDDGQCFGDMEYKNILTTIFKETKLSPRNFYEDLMDYGSFSKKEGVKEEVKL